jgi:hypothetical protein
METFKQIVSKAGLLPRLQLGIKQASQGRKIYGRS